MKLIRNKEPAGIASVFVYFAIRSANFYWHNSAREMKVCWGYEQMIVSNCQTNNHVFIQQFIAMYVQNTVVSQTNLLFRYEWRISVECLTSLFVLSGDFYIKLIKVVCFFFWKNFRRQHVYIFILFSFPKCPNPLLHFVITYTVDK